jgi:hypothetical protein
MRVEVLYIKNLYLEHKIHNNYLVTPKIGKPLSRLRG